MTLRKDIPASPATTRTVAPRRPSVWIRVFALLLEIPPLAYVAFTGHAPGWIRLWLMTWLTVWLIGTAAQTAKAQEAGGAS